MLQSPRPLLALFTLLAVITPRMTAQEWQVLHPTSATAESGTTLSIDSDGRVVASKPVKPKDTFEILAPTDLTAITAIRIEVLPHPKVPKEFLSWASNGNFVMTQVQLAQASQRSPKKMRDVALGYASATFCQSGWSPTGLTDNSQKTGWAILPHAKKRAAAVVETAQQVGKKGGTLLRVRMRFEYGNDHIPGCLRISVCQQVRPVRAANDLKWGAVQSKINQAIDRGVEWLLDQQRPDGSWRGFLNEYPTGTTALAAYTLMKSGLDPDHGAVQRALRFIKAREPDRVYDTSVQIIALCTSKTPDDKKHATRLVRKLLGWADRGGFGYPAPPLDLSNSQYAALALWRASDIGIKVRTRVWKSLMNFTLDHQVEEEKGSYAAAGFAYRKNGKPTGSMTAAGVGTLSICDRLLKGKQQKLIIGMKQGLKWLGDNFSPSQNVGTTDDRWLYYYLYGMERAGDLSGEELFGPHNWYRDGARFLVEKQHGTGNWATKYGEAEANTCFALLFLARATSSVSGSHAAGARVFGAMDAKHDVSLKASGDQPLAIWVAGYGDGVRKKLTWPGDEPHGPRVTRAQYFASRYQSMKDAKPLGLREGSAKRPAGVESFSIQHAFSHPGVYWIQAKVTCAIPVAEGEDGGTTSVIESKPLRVTTWDIATEKILAAADSVRQNLLIRPGCDVTASSHQSDGWKPDYAVDGLSSRSWRCHETDKAPWIKVRLARGVRANTLMLTHTADYQGGSGPRIQEVEVLINGKSSLGTFKLVMDDRRRTRIPLVTKKNVRSLMIRVTKTTKAGPVRVGFSEVELLLEG